MRLTELKSDVKRLDANLTEHRLYTERALSAVRTELKDFIAAIRLELKEEIAAARSPSSRMT